MADLGSGSIRSFVAAHPGWVAAFRSNDEERWELPVLGWAVVHTSSTMTEIQAVVIGEGDHHPLPVSEYVGNIGDYGAQVLEVVYSPGTFAEVP